MLHFPRTALDESGKWNVSYFGPQIFNDVFSDPREVLSSDSLKLKITEYVSSRSILVYLTKIILQSNL